MRNQLFPVRVKVEGVSVNMSVIPGVIEVRMRTVPAGTNNRAARLMQ